MFVEPPNVEPYNVVLDNTLFLNTFCTNQYKYVNNPKNINHNNAYDKIHANIIDNISNSMDVVIVE